MFPDHIFDQICAWARRQSSLAAIGVVGSHARGTARPDSDIDLIILCDTPEDLLKENSWRSEFGDIGRSEFEDWGAVQSIRTFYKSGAEIEFGIAAVNWASIPVDSGTFQVVSNGMKILYDPRGLLCELQAVVGKVAG